MTETTVGQASEITEADKAAAQRRLLVQSVFETCKTKEPLMAGMTEHNISVTELAQALDYKLDAIAYLRDIGVPDGFQGLKVWPQSELDKYYAWQAVTHNALGLVVGPPAPAVVQAVIDREHANHAINLLHVIPWH